MAKCPPQQEGINPYKSVGLRALWPINNLNEPGLLPVPPSCREEAKEEVEGDVFREGKHSVVSQQPELRGWTGQHRPLPYLPCPSGRRYGAARPEQACSNEGRPCFPRPFQPALTCVTAPKKTSSPLQFPTEHTGKEICRVPTLEPFSCPAWDTPSRLPIPLFTPHPSPPSRQGRGSQSPTQSPPPFL